MAHECGAIAANDPLTMVLYNGTLDEIVAGATIERRRMQVFDIARSTERSGEPGSAGHAPGQQTLTSPLPPAPGGRQGAGGTGASFGAPPAADPFWFAADATFAVG